MELMETRAQCVFEEHDNHPLQLKSTDVTVLEVNPAVPNIQEITETLKELQVTMKARHALQQASMTTEFGVTIATLMMKQQDEFNNKNYTIEECIKDYEAYRRWFNARCPVTNCPQQLLKENDSVSM